MKHDSNSVPFDEDFQEGLALELALQNTSIEDVLAGHEASQRDALAELVRGAAFQERVQEMKLWVGETREQLVDWQGGDDAQAAALSPRILEASTRRRSRFSPSDSEPQGLWGDAKILMGFMRRRLSSSVALRLAAASLVAHLIALPALAAYIYWMQPEESKLILRVDPDHPVLPDEVTEVAPEELLEEDANLWSALGLQETNAIAGAKYELTHGDWTGLDREVAEPWDSWVQVRMHRLRSDSKVSALDASPSGVGASFGHVLAFDMALDDWILGRGSESVVVGGAHVLVGMTQAASGTDDALGGLALAALTRAREYGLLGDDALPSGGAPSAPQTVLDPLSSTWFEWLRRLEAGSDSGLTLWTAWFQNQR